MHLTKTTWHFFLLCLLYLLIAAPIQMFFGIIGLVITQVLFFLLPPLFIAWRTGEPLSYLRIHEVPFSAFFWPLALGLLAIPVATFLNGSAIVFLRWLGMRSLPLVDLSNMALPPTVALIVFAVIPGLCEEMMFRGVFLRRLNESLSLRASMIWSAVFFGLIHFNVYNLLSPIYLGIVFALLVYAYDSLLPAILGHTYFNAIVFYIQWNEPTNAEMLGSLQAKELLAVFPLALMGVFSSSVIIARLIRKKPRPLAMDALEPEADVTPPASRAGVWLPLLLTILLYAGFTLVSEWVMRTMIHV